MEGLGSRIKLIRDARSQEDFAALLGIGRSTLGSYEIDRREPKLKTLLQIATVGVVSLDWLAGRLNDTSIEQDQNYNRQEWYYLIDLAVGTSPLRNLDGLLMPFSLLTKLRKKQLVCRFFPIRPQ